MNYRGNAARRQYVAPRPAPWRKHCTACPKTYSLPEYRALALVGYQDGDGPGLRLELRNCTCGSTLAIEVTVPQRPAVAPVLHRDIDGRCCSAAVEVRCVCRRRWECPIHGGHCVGEHN